MRNDLASRVTRLSVALATGGVALWLWHCWCVFPSQLFNELRLEPSFLLANGVPIYPDPTEGPVTTWIYGPLSPILFLPATLAGSAASALMIAGFINLLIVVGSLSLTCALWPVAEGSRLTALDRLLGILVCIMVWPGSSLQDLQADNAAVAFGLIGNLFLVRARPGAVNIRWCAAAMAVAAVGCKQTAWGALFAQILWLGWREGWRAGIGHAVRGAFVGAALALAALALFGPAGLWLNVVRLPSLLPWTNEWLARGRILAPYLAIHIAGPMIILVLARHRIWNRYSPLLLPALSWLAALPLGLAAVFKIGGTLNSLESYLLFLPSAIPTFVALQKKSRWIQPRIVAGVIAIAALRFYLVLGPRWVPRVAHFQEAKSIAAQSPQQIWFPWNPLITYYSDHRFDHVEDGMFVRFVCGLPLTMTEARAHLPPHWKGMAIRRGNPEWGLAIHLCPPDARLTETQFWTLRTWASQNPPSSASK